jgi:hypothetical protein
MANLSLFLSSIANDIRRAKMLTDLDTARQSARFLQDDFLRLLPIVRVDLDQVRLHFRIGIEKLTSAPRESRFLSGIVAELESDPGKLNKELRATIQPQITDSAAQAAIATIIPQLTELDISRLPASTKLLSERFGQLYSDKMKSKTPHIDDNSHQSIKASAAKAFSTVLTDYSKQYGEDFVSQLLFDLSSVEVVVEGNRLKEFPPEMLMEVDITLSPRSYHWSEKAGTDPKAKPENRFIMMPGS